jgi:hypothetical protein
VQPFLVTVFSEGVQLVQVDPQLPAGQTVLELPEQEEPEVLGHAARVVGTAISKIKNIDNRIFIFFI